MNKLLARIIERHFPDEAHDASQFRAFFNVISDSFSEFEEDRYMLERSLMLTSEELMEINEKLRQKLVENEEAKKLVEEGLAKRQAQLDASQEAVMSFVPGGKIALINRAAAELMELSNEEIYKNSGDDNYKTWSSKLSDPQGFHREIDKINKDPSLRLKGEVEFKDGRYFQYYSIPEFLGARYLGRVWCFRDVTELKLQQKELKHQAFHDSLTGLPNRVYLLESLTHALDLAKRSSVYVAIMFIDLDNFKFINDSAGHETGDRYIIGAGKLIREQLRAGDIIGRLGGDEFLVILEGTQHQYEIEQVKNRIMNCLGDSINIADKEYVLSCSIGISVYPNDGADPDNLIRKADMAMYQAKQEGKNTFRYFDPSLEHIALHRMDIERKLRKAINENAFFLVYQPKIDIVSQNIIGLEALLRWKDESDHIIFPTQFISLAENIGLIHRITRVVLEKACEQMTAWRDTCLEDIPVSINISPKDFNDPDLIKNIRANLQRFNISSGQLELEITESLFLEDTKKAREIIEELRTLGVKISIDDFGTGYSSLSVLQELEVDYLKIDRCFISRASENIKSAAIVKSIIDIAKHLSLDVIAEGVETIQDAKFIRDSGCTLCQGYLYSKPLLPEDLLKFSLAIHNQSNLLGNIKSHRK